MTESSKIERMVPVGWAARFSSGQLYLTPHDFERAKWLEQGLPVWPVFAHNDCTCAACSRAELHSSDCAVHNEPAATAGECNCGAGADSEMSLAEATLNARAWFEPDADAALAELEHRAQQIVEPGRKEAGE